MHYKLIRLKTGARPALRCTGRKMIRFGSYGKWVFAFITFVAKQGGKWVSAKEVFQHIAKGDYPRAPEDMSDLCKRITSSIVRKDPMPRYFDSENDTTIRLTENVTEREQRDLLRRERALDRCDLFKRENLIQRWTDDTGLTFFSLAVKKVTIDREPWEYRYAPREQRKRKRKTETIPSCQNKFLLPAQSIGFLHTANKTAKEEDWPRKRGPIASDFEGGFVYPPPKLKDLRATVLKNPATLLEGKSATGKTVLVRKLAFDLLKEGEHRVWYFDYAGDFKGLDVYGLRQEINSTAGVIIIENIHLAQGQIQDLYVGLDQQSSRHVLFTARDSMRDLIDSGFLPLLNEIPTVPLNSFCEVDEMIDFFFLRKESECPHEDRQNLKRVSDGNFWLLALALKEYFAPKHNNAPEDWIGDQARRDLDDFYKINTEFPKILVALSSLYRHEVLTAEDFLTEKLGIHKSDLLALHKRGEITRQESDDYTCYGLQHSSLAVVYWAAGQPYWNRCKKKAKLPQVIGTDTENSIYHYAISLNSNALRAVVYADKNTASRVLQNLKSRNKLRDVVRAERRLVPITLLMLNHPAFFEFDEDCTRALAEKFNTAPAGWAIKQLYLLCLYYHIRKDEAHLDVPLLQEHINWERFFIFSCQDAVYDSEHLQSLLALNRPCAQATIKQLDMQQILTRLRRIKEESSFFGWIAVILQSDSTRVDELKSIIDMKQLARLLYESDSPLDPTHCLQSIIGADIETAKEFCAFLDARRIAAMLTSPSEKGGYWNSPFDASAFIYLVHSCDKDKARRIVALIKDQEMRTWIQRWLAVGSQVYHHLQMWPSAFLPHESGASQESKH